MKKIMMTGGGSSGHITPNIALIPSLEKCGYSVYYIGSKHGLEKNLIEKIGIPFHSINSGKLRRYFDFKNVTDLVRIVSGFLKSVQIIFKIKPDVLFSKGGFVSSPVVWASWLCRVPIIIHESDITPGLSNRLSIPFAKKICYSFPESKEHINAEKGILTGIPIREDLFKGEQLEGMRLCQFNNGKPIITIMEGSQGSSIINQVIRSTLDQLLEKYQICHICGQGNLTPDLNSLKGYKQIEYINTELLHIFAITDICISRAGATTLFELLALKIPSILIPLSRKASRGDQILNAQSFEKAEYSLVIQEEEFNSELLLDRVECLFMNREVFLEKMNSSNQQDSIKKIIQIIEHEVIGN